MVSEQGILTTIADPQSTTDLLHWNGSSFWNGLTQPVSVPQQWERIGDPNSSAVADLPWIPAPQSAHEHIPINEFERQPWIEFDPLASSVDSRYKLQQLL